MDLTDNRSVDHQLCQYASDPVPTEVEDKLRVQLSDFQSRMNAQKLVPNPVSMRRSAVWLRWSVTFVSVALIAIAIGMAFMPRSGLAQVAKAVMKQPWIHLQSDQTDGTPSHEGWVSLEKGISATRGGGTFKYEDHRLRVYYSYKLDEQVVYRVPIVGMTEAAQLEGLFDTLKILIKSSPETPLSHLPFPGAEDTIKVLSQRTETVVEQEKTWLDFHLTVKYLEMPEAVQLLFRVDNKTQLLQLVRAEGQVNGTLVKRDIRFDYPDKGPVDIYELGVPRMAKLVDRVPDGELKRIAETLKAGRNRMDNYRAVFITRNDGLDSNWWEAFPEVFYRKGNCFRRDFITAGVQDGKLKRPAEDADLQQWWFDRAKQFTYLPVSLQIGSMAYNCDRKSVDRADGTKGIEIDTVKKYQHGNNSDDSWPVDYVMRPEFACRPPMGLGHENLDITLDLHPAEGPPECVLISVRNRMKEGRMNDKGVGVTDINRYWLDPKRDFIAKRWEMVMLDDSGKESIVGQHEIEETARSPQGVWYATKVRLKNAARTQDGKSFDRLYLIYVDFDAKVPDYLFQPPKPKSAPTKLD